MQRKIKPDSGFHGAAEPAIALARKEITPPRRNHHLGARGDKGTGRTIALLKELAPRAEKAGLVLGLENHWIQIEAAAPKDLVTDYQAHLGFLPRVFPPQG